MFGFLKRRRERIAREKREREEALLRARRAQIERFDAQLGRPHCAPRGAPTIKTSSPPSTVHVYETRVYDPTPDLVTAAMLTAIPQPVYVAPLVADAGVCIEPVSAGYDASPAVDYCAPSYDPSPSYDSGSSWDSSSSCDFGSSSSDW